jgi:hypothetical protein
MKYNAQHFFAACLAAEVTETLPQTLKRDPRTDGSYARLKACSTHRLYTRRETAMEHLKP